MLRLKRTSGGLSPPPRVLHTTASMVLLFLSPTRFKILMSPCLIILNFCQCWSGISGRKIWFSFVRNFIKKIYEASFSYFLKPKLLNPDDFNQHFELDFPLPPKIIFPGQPSYLIGTLTRHVYSYDFIYSHLLAARLKSPVSFSAFLQASLFHDALTNCPVTSLSCEHL